jgi:hypothetical protein
MPIGISSASVQYFPVPVNAPTMDGVAVDPTVFAVSCAFIPLPAHGANPEDNPPGDGDWVVASWHSFPKAPYCATTLIGNGGAVDLTQGTYAVWVRIEASPQNPVMMAPTFLTIT